MVLVFLALIGISFAIPLHPEWQTFTANFTEVVDIQNNQQKTVTGLWAYDPANNLQRLERAEGQWDMICRGDYSTCVQYNSGGHRYIDYPARDQCCYCCSDEEGCGLLKDNWLANGTFIGQTTFDGKTSYEWDQKGFSDNFFYETTETDPKARTMLGIVTSGKSITFTSYQNTADQSMFALPSRCAMGVTCSWTTFCSEMRNTTTPSS